jgi:Icc protein
MIQNEKMKLNRRSLLKAAGVATGIIATGGLPALASAGNNVE